MMKIAGHFENGGGGRERTAADAASDGLSAAEWRGRLEGDRSRTRPFLEHGKERPTYSGIRNDDHAQYNNKWHHLL